LYLNGCQNTVKSIYPKYKIILYTFKNSSKTWDLNHLNKSSLALK
jgi:hypothetical protein